MYIFTSDIMYCLKLTQNDRYYYNANKRQQIHDEVLNTSFQLNSFIPSSHIVLHVVARADTIMHVSFKFLPNFYAAIDIYLLGNNVCYLNFIKYLNIQLVKMGLDIN